VPVLVWLVARLEAVNHNQLSIDFVHLRMPPSETVRARWHQSRVWLFFPYPKKGNPLHGAFSILTCYCGVRRTWHADQQPSL